MKKEKNNLPKAAALRQKAEEQLIKKHAATKAVLTESDTLKLLHELEVHQVELEMQNEELQVAEGKATTATEKLSLLYDFAPMGYFTLDRDGRICELNLSGALLLGKDRSNLINSNFKSFIARDTLATFDEFSRNVFELDVKQVCEVKLTIKDNLSIYVHIEGILSQDKQKCLATAVDITDRKRVEEALKESEERYRTFINATGDMAYLKDDTFHYLIINRKNAAFFGKEPEEITGKDDFDIMPREAAASCRESDETALREDKIVISEETLDGRIYETRKFPVRLAGGHKGVGGFIRDITERVQAEETLRSSEEKFRNLFENSPAGNSITEIDGSIHVNKSFCSMVGYSEEELKTKKWMDITHPEDIQPNWDIIQSLKDGKISQAHFEKRFIHKNGNIVYADLLSYVQRDKNNNPQFFITTVTDITERKGAEEEIRKLNEELERKIVERTADLQKAITHLEDLNRVFVGRELRMTELKEQIAEMEKLMKQMQKKGV